MPSTKGVAYAGQKLYVLADILGMKLSGKSKGDTLWIEGESRMELRPASDLMLGPTMRVVSSFIGDRDTPEFGVLLEGLGDLGILACLVYPEIAYVTLFDKAMFAELDGCLERMGIKSQFQFMEILGAAWIGTFEWNTIVDAQGKWVEVTTTRGG